MLSEHVIIAVAELSFQDRSKCIGRLHQTHTQVIFGSSLGARAVSTSPLFVVYAEKAKEIDSVDATVKAIVSPMRPREPSKTTINLFS